MHKHVLKKAVITVPLRPFCYSTFCYTSHPDITLLVDLVLKSQATPTSYFSIHLEKLLWMYCPGHACLTSGLLLRKSEVLRSLRHSLRAQNQGHHTIDRLEERGVERGRTRRSSLKGREQAIVRQTLEPFERQCWGNF